MFLAKKWRMLDLFSGLGGFTMAAHEVWGDNLETVSFVEIDKRCREFLSRAWPGVQIHEDIKTLDAKQWRGTIDLCCGGPPCQPVSCAGKRKGKEDYRWLWEETLQVVADCLPTWCLLENPPAIRTMGLDGILSALETLGYTNGTTSIPACSINAPHLRHRYWIICHRNQVGLADLCSEGCEGCEQHGSHPEQGARTHLPTSEHTQGHLADTNEGGSENGQMDGECVCGCDFQRDNSTNNITTIEKHSSNLEHTATAGLEEGKPDQNGLQDFAKRPLLNHWYSCVWLPCADGKVRRSPDDSQRMAHGLPVELLEALGEEGREDWSPEDCEPHRSILAALGNSIVPQVAIEILKAIKEASQ